MNRGLTVSLGLHVAAFVAVLVGPAPEAFEWDVETVPVELVAAPLEFPEDRKPEARPEPERELPPPVVEKIPEQKTVEEPPADQEPDVPEDDIPF